VGDMRELEAVRQVFGEDTPKITSTKSLTGHSLGVAGVHEAIYTILMLHHDFISPSINIENIDENAEGFDIVTDLIEEAGLETVMSNSFGFGGTNASLVFKKCLNLYVAKYEGRDKTEKDQLIQPTHEE
jgi:3-oxoacyl-[acyl-carrier-protein] synthase-1